jgi:T3SS negative regulator,GrlR
VADTLAKRICPTSKTIIMIRNGLYSVTSKLLDGVEGGATGVSVLRDGTLRGGGAIYYHVGSYVCSRGKWKGELTIREHTLPRSPERLRGTSSAWDLTAHIPMKMPNLTQRLSWVSRAFN